MNTILGLLGFAARTASNQALMIIRVINENVRVALFIVM